MPTQTDETVDAWRRFKEDADPDARQFLIVHFSPLVKYVAGRVAAGLPSAVDVSDLIGYGMFGLIDAIEKFDTGAGTKFPTYAIARIRGAMIDSMRSLDWVPRSVRSKSRAIATAMSDLEGKLHRTPTDDELAEALDWTRGQLDHALQQISAGGLVALEDLSGGSRGEINIRAESGHEPGVYLDVRETHRMLGDGLKRLPDREREVIGLYYYEGMTLAEIGAVLGVSESRACQLHGKAVLHLRNYLRAAERA